MVSEQGGSLINGKREGRLLTGGSEVKGYLIFFIDGFKMLVD
jgi:hypothetical protein